MRRLRSILIALVVLLLVTAGGGFVLMNSTSTQIAGDLVDRVETEDKVVALTFDDGPSSEDADAVLDVLEDRGVRATFYLTGKEAEQDPGTVRRLHRAGHELGNHTWSHRRMVFVSTDDVAEEVESTDRAIRASGYTGPLTFRPPFGKKLIALPRYLAAHDRLSVMWDVAPETFEAGAPQTSQEIIDATLEDARPGSIVLLHPWNGRTATQEAIGPIIDDLHGRGYRFVTVSELTE